MKTDWSLWLPTRVTHIQNCFYRVTDVAAIEEHNQPVCQVTDLILRSLDDQFLGNRKFERSIRRCRHCARPDQHRENSENTVADLEFPTPE